MVAATLELIPPTVNRTVTLNIEKLVYGGFGLAFAEGRAFFILNALPGEIVRAEILREKKNTSFGTTLEILNPSLLRVDAPCPHFMRCGGCHLQHLGYPDQLHFKEEILRETFRRIGQLSLGEVEVVSGEPWQYRTRAQFKVARRGSHVDLGFFASQSHSLYPIDRCPLLSDPLNTALDQIQKERDKLAEPQVHVEEFQVRTNGDLTQWALDFIGRPPEFDFANDDPTLSGDGRLLYQTSFGAYRVSSNSFFQVNRFLLEPLVQKSLEEVSGNSALDLFAGVGLFSVPLAKRFQRVVAIEENPAAVNDLRFNLDYNNCANVEMVSGPVSSLLPWREEQWAGMEFVLLDPPRQGVASDVLKKLCERRIPLCVYVSCDPTSMARDIKSFCTAGYQIQKTLLLDFFPQTYHFETVMHLRRVS